MRVVIKLHPHQYRAITSDKRFIAIISGIQGGKTFTGSLWEGKQILQYPKDDHLIVSPTYKILNQSTLPKFFENLPTLQKHYHSGDSVIKLPEGGNVYIRSAENPNTIEGMTLRSAWLDEAGQMKTQAWINIQGRLSIKQGRAFLTTTPYAMNWLFHDFYQQWKKGNSNYEVIEFKSADSPFFPKEEYERMKKILTPEMFAMRYEGKFSKFSGLVYKDFDRSINVYSQHKDYKAMHKFRTIDFGYNNPFVCLWIAVDYDDNMYVYREHYEAERSTDYHAAKIKAYQVDINGVEIEPIKQTFGDPSAKQLIADFSNKGIYITPAKNDVVAGINKVMEKLKPNYLGLPKLFIHESCKNTIDEFETYSWKPKDDEKNSADEPIKFADHAMDALKYFVHSYYRPQDENSIEAKLKKLYNKDWNPNTMYR